MHKIAAIALWMSTVFTALVAFHVFVVVDEAQPVGTQSAFDVVQVSTATKSEALEAIQAVATTSGHTILKVQPDLRESRQGRILFAFVGDAEAFAAHGWSDYPIFAPHTTATTVRPAAEITTEDLRGRYVTDATPAELATLLVELDERGISAQDDSVGPLLLVLYAVSTGNLSGPFVVVLLALGLAIAYSVARRRKIYALREIHGYRRSTNLKAEIGALTRTFGVGLLGLAIVALPVLGLYNGFRQLTRFAGVLAISLGILYLAAMALIIVAVLTTSRRSVPEVLKGERSSVREGVGAAAVQIIVLAVVVATTTAAMSRIEAIDATVAQVGRWTQGDALYALRLSETGTHADDLRDAPQLAAAVGALERAGAALLVGYKGGADEQGPGPSWGPDETGSLIVNNSYLDREAVVDADGQRLHDLPGGKNQFTLLVPTPYGADTATLLGDYVAYFESFCSLGRADGDFSCDPEGTVVRTQPGQELFTYNGTAFLPAQMQERMFVTDPVLAVVQTDSELLGPMEYLSYSSLDDVLFTDPEMLADELTSRGISGSFQGIDNAADAVTMSIALAQQQLRMDAVSIALGWVVLVMSAMVSVAVYCDRRRRPMFVQLIHGYSFLARHAHYLAGAVLLSLLGVGVAHVVGGSLAHIRDLVVSGAFVAAHVAVSLGAITIYEKRFRADFIKRN